MTWLSLNFLPRVRVGEVAWIQCQNISLRDNLLVIKDCCIWSYQSKKFSYLKPITKNGEIREVRLTDGLKEILGRRLLLKNSESDFLFHLEGKPLSYRQIQYQYNKALKMAGVEDISSTHFLRHSAANLVRLFSNSLEYAQAITGHKDRSTVEKVYTVLPSDHQLTALKMLEKNIKIPKEM